MKKLFSSQLFRFCLFLGLMASLVVGGKLFSVDTRSIAHFLQRVPVPYAAAAFVAFYVIGTFFIWYLKDPLKILGAVLFGAYLSTLLIYIAEIINSYIFFHISTVLGKGFIENSLRGRFKRFYEKLEALNLGWVFLLRGVPVIPYRVLDLSFGLSKFSFRKYLLVVLIASLPRIFWIQFILAALKGLSLERVLDCLSHNIVSCFSLILDEMTTYFMQNSLITVISFLYFVIALITLFSMKKKFR